MVIPRIVAGRAFLDKLPYWIAVPVGLIIGLAIGYWVSGPELTTGDLSLAMVAVAVVLWLGFSTPRPAPLAREPAPTQPAKNLPIPDSQEW